MLTNYTNAPQEIGIIEVRQSAMQDETRVKKSYFVFLSVLRASVV